MTTMKDSLKHIWLLCVLLLVSLLCSGLYYHTLELQSRQTIQRIRVYYADRTGNFINTVFHKTDTLAAVVKLQNGNISQKTFDQVAQLVYTPNSGIRGIQYMPGAVVTYSYPVAGNEGVIGKNFFKIPERLKDVELAINTRSIALSGPYNLIQGGLGVVARNPVFLTDAAGKEYFWGFPPSSWICRTLWKQLAWADSLKKVLISRFSVSTKIMNAWLLKAIRSWTLLKPAAVRFRYPIIPGRWPWPG